MLNRFTLKTVIFRNNAGGYDVSYIDGNKRIRYIRDIVLDSDNDYTEIIVHYRCKTPLNEFDTCAMICRYFESVYFEDESGETFFTPKNGC